VLHAYRCLGLTPGRLMCVITPSGFGGFFEEIGAVVAVCKDRSRHRTDRA
jgi:hypothetical protein